MSGWQDNCPHVAVVALQHGRYTMSLWKHGGHMQSLNQLIGKSRLPTVLRIAGVLGIALWIASCSNNTDQTASTRDDASKTPSKLGDVGSNADHLSAGIAGTKHDFTHGSGRSLDLCTPCHTPHLSVVKPPVMDSREPLAQRLRPYSGEGVDLDESSLLCLSCHDGVVAKDVYRSAHAARISSQLGSSWVGKASLTSHPIGVKFPIGDSTYRTIEAATADGAIKLPGGRLQCISCHDPHNTKRFEYMLVRSNQGSRLCLACHRL